MKLLEEIRSRLEALRHRYQSTILPGIGIPPAAEISGAFYWQSKAAAMDDDAREIINLLPPDDSTPPPTVWHRASEKLPTEADGDYDGRVWVYFLESYAHPRMRLVPVDWVTTVYGDYYWTPTNFTKPKPPAEV